MSRIVLFSLPMLIGNIFQQFYNMADAIIVGRFISGQALAAVGSAGIVVSFLVAILSGLCTGASVVISQYYGAKQEENLKRTVSTTIIFLIVFALLISVIGVIFMPHLLRLLNFPADVFDSAVLYMRIIMSGVVFLMLFNIYDAFLRALGDSRTSLYCLIFATLLNLILDFWFVAILGWGVTGAAIATDLSILISVIPCYHFVIKKVPLLQITSLKFDPILFKTILRFSIPAALQLSMVNLASLTIMRLVNSFGSNAAAGYALATKIDQLALMPSNSISMASASFAGQNIGANLEDRARKGLKATLVFMVGLAFGISIILLVFGKVLLSLFLKPNDPNYTEIISVGINYLSAIAVFYFLHSTLFAFNGFFRGVGDAVIVMILTVTSLSIRTISAYIMVQNFGMGPEAVAWSIPIGWFITSLIGWFYYSKGWWRGKSAIKKSDIGEG